MATTTYYRIQPAGLSLFGHNSEDWEGNEMTGGHVCAYSDADLVLSGRGDDWFDHEIDSCEIVEFEGRDSQWLASSNAGVSVVPTREIRRQPLRCWLDEQGEDTD